MKFIDIKYNLLQYAYMKGWLQGIEESLNEIAQFFESNGRRFVLID